MVSDMKNKLLFLTNLLPYPLDSGGKIKSYNTLMLLKDSFDIDLFCFIEADQERAHLAQIEKLGIKVNFVKLSLRHQQTPLILLWEVLKSLFSAYPYVVNKYRSPKMEQLLLGSLGNNDHDYLYIDHLQLFSYVKSLLKYKPVKPIVVLDQHNVESDIIRRRRDETKNIIARIFLSLELYKLLLFEKRSCVQADLVLAITEIDRARLLTLTAQKSNCKTAPFFIDKIENVYKGGSDEKTILFVGTMSWYPNEHGVLWFYTNVFKAFGLAQAGWKLLIVGNSPGDRIRELSKDAAVRVTGRVEDLKPYYSTSTMAVVPLFIGGGMRIKILDLFAVGLPVISTSIGCEGIPVSDGKNILIADTADQFMASLQALSKDKALRSKISSQASLFLSDNYSFEKAQSRYLEIILKRGA